MYIDTSNVSIYIDTQYQDVLIHIFIYLLIRSKSDKKYLKHVQKENIAYFKNV